MNHNKKYPFAKDEDEASIRVAEDIEAGQSIANGKRKLSLRGAKRRACTPKCLLLQKRLCTSMRYGTQAWQSIEIASLRSQ
jgi:hypothetical protein